MIKSSALLQFPAFKQAFSATFALSLLSLVLLDLGSKYLATQQLRFHLTPRQTEMYHHPALVNQLYPAEKTVKEQYSIIGDGGRILRIRLYFNDRSAFSRGPVQNQSRLVQTLMISLALLMVYWWSSGYIKRRLFRTGWLLVLGGSYANFIDRLFIKSLSDRSWNFSLQPGAGHISGVTDFIDLIWFGSHKLAAWPFLDTMALKRFPVFNLADSYLFFGMLILAYFIIGGYFKLDR